MLTLLLPYASKSVKKPVDRLAVSDLSPELIRKFLTHLEQYRRCSVATRNQRLGGLHALARFIGENSPEHVEWCTQVRLIPFKRASQPAITYLDKPEMDAILDTPDLSKAQGQRDYTLLLFLYNSGARASEAAELKMANIDWHARGVRIIGKGNKQRTCFLWQLTIQHLHKITVRRSQEQNVFFNRNGQPVTRFGIHTMVERHATKAAV